MSAEECTLIETNRIKALQRKRLCELRNDVTKRLRITGKQTSPTPEMGMTVTSNSQSSQSWINTAHGIYTEPESSTAHLDDPSDDYVAPDKDVVDDFIEEEDNDAPPIPDDHTPPEEARKKRTAANQFRN